MRLLTPTCPECGEPAQWTVDCIPGGALIDLDEDGTFEYAGETKMFWDGQTTETDEEGRLLVGCGEHEWFSEVEGD